MNALDTAFNYGGFSAHRELARTAGDLLGRFEISTKVGYFPGGHDLHPARLLHAVDQVAMELGRIPDTVLLHNPEHAPDHLADAGHVLAAARDGGLCRAWGISTWNPLALLGAARWAPRPDVLMVRCGLLAPAQVLDIADELAGRLGSPQLWGMAPFAGRTSDPVWSTVDTSQFLEPSQQATPLQAGFAAAFTLPHVARIAVGTQRLDHLDELIAARSLAVNADNVTRYRTLIRRAGNVPRGPHTPERAHATADG